MTPVPYLFLSFLPSAAGLCRLRQGGAAAGGRVLGAVPAVLLLQLLHLHRAQRPQRPACPTPRVSNGVPPYS